MALCSSRNCPMADPIKVRAYRYEVQTRKSLTFVTSGRFPSAPVRVCIAATELPCNLLRTNCAKRASRPHSPIRSKRYCLTSERDPKDQWMRGGMVLQLQHMQWHVTS